MPNHPKFAECKRLAVLEVGQLVTLAGPKRPRFGKEMLDPGIVKGGAFLVEQGRFVKIGSDLDVEPLISPETEVIHCNGKAVLPGFVDAHTHLVFSGNRRDEFERRIRGESYQAIAASGGGIQSTVKATREASEEDLLLQGLKHAKWMLSCGTTTAECKSGYGLSTENEVKILRVIASLRPSSALKCVPTFLGAHATPPEYSGRTESYVEYLLEEMLPAVVASGLAEFCDAFCEVGYFSVDQCRRVLNGGKAFGLGIRIHADQLSECGGAVLAAELGANTADHLEQAGAHSLSALKQAGVQPVLLPGSVYGLGHTQYPNMRGMIEMGLSPILASDFNPGSSPTPSIPEILSLACHQMGILPAEAVVAATINAAYSLNRGETVGSIEVGKDADFIVLDCDDYRDIPYYFGRNPVSRVFVNGCAV